MLPQGGVYVARFIEMRIAGFHGVAFGLTHFSGFTVGRRSDHFPIRHLGFTFRLSVNRPSGAVVMRRAPGGAFIGVDTDTETQIGVFVSDFPLFGRVEDIVRNELLVRQGFPDQSAYGFPPRPPRLFSQHGFAGCGKAFQSRRHCLVFLLLLGAFPRLAGTLSNEATARNTLIVRHSR